LNSGETKNPNGESVRSNKIISDHSKNDLIPSIVDHSDCEKYSSEIIEGIHQVLSEVAKKDNLPQAIYDGLLGNKEEDGAYPGTFGRGTIRCK
jgi:hypothetical protein